MLKNKKFLIGFFTCAGLVLIMAHDYNNNHTHYEYADSYHSHGSDYHTHSEYADNYHTHDWGLTTYADEHHTHSEYADNYHTHDGWGGYAKQTDVSDLEARIEELESEIIRLRNHDH